MAFKHLYVADRKGLAQQSFSFCFHWAAWFRGGTLETGIGLWLVIAGWVSSGMVAFKFSTETYPNDSFCNIPCIHANLRKVMEYSRSHHICKACWYMCLLSPVLPCLFIWRCTCSTLLGEFQPQMGCKLWFNLHISHHSHLQSKAYHHNLSQLFWGYALTRPM